MRNKSLFLVLIGTSALLGLSCRWRLPEKFEVDTTSPNGVYRVKIQYREHWRMPTPTRSQSFAQSVKLQHLKGEELIGSYEFENWDPRGHSLLDNLVVVEWVRDNVLLRGIGRASLDHPYRNELIVSNNTDEYLKYMCVGAGKHSLFDVFDFAPRSQVTLLAFPGYHADHPDRYWVSYDGTTQSGKKFHGINEKKEKKPPPDGTLRFEIMINASDVR